MKIELYLEDPMGAGCGCSTSMKDRMELVKRIREEAQVWDSVKKKHSGEYTRTVITAKVPIESYPEHVRHAVDEGSSLPFVFIDENLVHSGSYPSLDEFKALIMNGG